jgi:hypothetical protein
VSSLTPSPKTFGFGLARIEHVVQRRPVRFQHPNPNEAGLDRGVTAGERTNSDAAASEFVRI